MKALQSTDKLFNWCLIVVMRITSLIRLNVCTLPPKIGLMENVHMRVHMGIYESPHGNT